MKKLVMVFGTFDMFHEGHADFMRQARKHGDYVIAVIARDSTVREVKGKESHQGEDDRLGAVRDSGLADRVVMGSISDKLDVVRQHEPDVICIGYDQQSFVRELEKEIKNKAIKAKVVRLKPYKPQIFKTSIIRKKVSEDGG